MKGLDCWGLVKIIYKDLGFNIKDIEDYEMEGHLHGHDYFKDRDGDDWERVSVPMQYDVALFLDTEGIAYHAGVMLPDGRMIHCAKNTGVAILNFESVKNKMRVDGFYRLKERNGHNKV